MATTQDIFHRAPESAAAIRRRLRAERKSEAGQKDADMLTQDSSIIVDQIITDKSRYIHTCIGVVYIVFITLTSFAELGTILEKKEQNSKSETAKGTRLYPPTNPYALVAIALDIRPAISSMVNICDVINTHTCSVYL